VKVAILDSCSSGSLTRAKGGVTRPAFLFDVSSDMSGHAYLTSASAEEAAQESDRIGGSFFTHYLISGLRGAADAKGDGLVTLEEAYAYAYQETLASTEKTQYGPQHPAWEIELSGSGSLVLTDLRSSSATLRVADDIAGRLYFRDADGNLAVELDKQYGQAVELGLEPGTYSVLLDSKSSRLGAEVRVSARQPATLTLSQLKPVAVESATARGDGPGFGPYGGSRAPAAVTDPTDPAAAFGAALGATIGSAIGKAAGPAVSAALDAVAAAVAAATGDTSQAADAPAGSLQDQPPAPDAAPQPSAAPPADTATTEPPPAAVPSQEPLTAAPDARRLRAFSLGIFPDAGEGIFSSQEDHVAAVNLLVGVSGSSLAFEVGGLANFESGSVLGFQAAGLVNGVKGDLTGFQTAGLVNYVGGDALFFQTAGLANVTAGTMTGGQAAGIVNWAGTGMRGAQVAGVVNYAGDMKGPQISVVNVAGSITGAQIGVVNIAREVTGTQIGVLNISGRMNGLPIGLISIEAEGRHDVDLWVDLDGTSYAAFSLGTRRFYSVLSAGWTPGTVPAQWSAGLGLGGRSDLGPFFVDYDLSMVAAGAGFPSSNVPDGALYPRVRAVIGLPLFGGDIAVVAGAAVRILLPDLSYAMPGADPATVVLQPSIILGVHL
jgi:hypothetical protein